jgi:hypothetical protein
VSSRGYVCLFIIVFVLARNMGIARLPPWPGGYAAR